MDEKDIKKILQIILRNLGDKQVNWRLEGSANLKIQGVEVSVRDLDITTNENGNEIFKNTLKEFVIKDFFSKKVMGRSLICNINGFEVEINCYGDRKLEMFDKTEKISWNGMKIPILPLEYAKKFYEAINRNEKAGIISNYLKNKVRKHADIIALILYKDGKILVEKRKSIKKDDPGKIIIPSGHVEKGETNEEACKRELKEELDLDCDKFRLVIKLPNKTKDEDQDIYFYSCEDWSGELKVLDAEKVFWVSPDKIGIIDYEIDIKAIKEFLKMKNKKS
jgi:8-oxo-dGTP diphosphatase